VVSDERLRRVMEAVRGELAARWSVAGMAEVAAMSRSSFSRAFRQATGHSPGQWVLDQRVQRAEWLMRTTDQPLSEIAGLVGFGSPSRLTEAFVRRHGEPPSTWRARQ
jgi:transcriptional regulator GlxA family with amidase domain